MTERHLRAVLAEAERVAEHYDQVAKAKDSPAHEYLRYAVLRLLEGDANSLPEEVRQVDGVTVGYGRDQSMYDSWGSDVERFGTAAFKEQVRADAAEEPFVDEPGTLAVSRC